MWPRRNAKGKIVKKKNEGFVHMAWLGPLTLEFKRASRSFLIINMRTKYNYLPLSYMTYLSLQYYVIKIVSF